MWVGLGNLPFEEPQSWLSDCVNRMNGLMFTLVSSKGIDLAGMQNWGRSQESLSLSHNSLGIMESFCFIPEEPQVHGDVGGIC